jgi:predicted ATP-dependent endonuclease of OLD family
MAIKLKSIRLHNFKKFEDVEIPIFESHTVLVGDNESGKSSILTALDLVLSGSRHKVEYYGLENLINYECISKFMASDRSLDKLPESYIDLFIEKHEDDIYCGRTNSKKRDYYGLRFRASPNEEYHSDIKEILKGNGNNFPFEFYSIEFKYFSDKSYNSYTRGTNHILIDNSIISSKLATSQYIKSVFLANVDLQGRTRLRNLYRDHKERFANNYLRGLNQSSEFYEFSLKSSVDSNLEADLNLEEEGVPIQNRGKGKQCFIKTDFALQKKSRSLDCLLLEEPENHLSHTSMHRLINRISETADTQIIIATHNSLICNRLNLRNAVLLNSLASNFATLRDLDESTAAYFMKAPNNNMLEFVLSSKTILVEGDAEYILIKAFVESLLNKPLEATGIHVISVGGTSFPRYLSVAKLLDIKTAVITDNDGNYSSNITERYSEFKDDKNIRIFAEESKDLSTFEMSVYECNRSLCDSLFSSGRRSLTVLEFMLQNKAHVAFQLLENASSKIVCPTYIKDAIQWIK